MRTLGTLLPGFAELAAHEDAYRQALALDPKNDDYRLSLAKALQVRLKAEEALTLYEDYRHRHPDDAAALRGMAQCAADGGDLKRAVEIMRDAFERNPDDFETQKGYGELLLSLGDAAEAAAVLKEAYRSVPEHANLAYALARALKASGRVAEAEPLFAFVAESRPKLEELTELEKKLREKPKDLALRMKIAGITAKYVSRRDAIRWYENLLRVAPNYVPAHQAIAELYRQLGDEERADWHERFGPSTPLQKPDAPAPSSAGRGANKREQRTASLGKSPHARVYGFVPSPPFRGWESGRGGERFITFGFGQSASFTDSIGFNS